MPGTFVTGSPSQQGEEREKPHRARVSMHESLQLGVAAAGAGGPLQLADKGGKPPFVSGGQAGGPPPEV